MENKMDNEYRRAANITVIVAGMIALAYLFLKYALSATLPFLLAIPVAALISPTAKKLSKKLKISEKLIAGVLVIIVFLSLSFILYYAGIGLAEEIGSLIDRLSRDPEAIVSAIDGFADALSRLTGRFGFLKRLADSESVQRLGLDIDRLLSDALNSTFTSLTSALPSAAMGMVSKIPSALLSTVVFLFSCFYFSTDGKKIGDYFASLLPDHQRKKLPALKERCKHTLSSYCKAYLLIMLMTFAEVLVGLSILKVRYALLMSLIIAIVDILPILGTGTVLIPWAIFAYVMGDGGLGTGLLILYAIVLILRQLIEPKIVGSSLGLHPLATLASIYLGIKLIGLGGIFIGPAAALLIKGISGDSDKAKGRP